MVTPLWRLHRDDFHDKANAVRGFLTYLGEEVCVLQTIENLARRIPPGDYECVRDYWYRGSMETWEIIWPHDEDGDGQPDRDRLLFHPANAVRNEGGELILLGCVAPGMERVEIWGQPGVASSRVAFARLEEVTGTDTERFTMRVTEAERSVYQPPAR